MTIISQNINGKYIEATNHLDIDTLGHRPDVVCWQETHTSNDCVNNHTNANIRKDNTMVFRNLTNQKKTDKASANKSSRVTNSKGIIIFLSKKLTPHSKIIDISRQAIAIGIQTNHKATTLIINIYAPATKTENKLFWKDFAKNISSCKAKCKSIFTLKIVGDLKTTTLKNVLFLDTC